MHFHKIEFFAFLAGVLVVYWRLRGHAWRMGWLLAASAVLYVSFSPWFLVVLLAATSIDYLVALRLPKATEPQRRWLVGLSVGCNLAVLCFFKYLAFALDTGRTLAGWLGWDIAFPAWRVALPLGISFYTFEAISYVVDVYRGKSAPILSLRDYLLYILFFPHLMAGPIVRSGDFAPQLRKPKRFSWSRLELGVGLFLIGLFKKAVIADRLAEILDPVFSRPGEFGAAAAWLAALAYPLQIYGDFSGYSDMALGMAHMLGFKLPANFRQPFFATSIGDYWRRWHITLSSWLRDYLYQPLGGSRHGLLPTLRNLMIVMTLSGLWHGAKWTMVAWGAIHGALLCLERVARLPRTLAVAPLFIAGTYLAQALAFVVFRSATLADSGSLFHAMLTFRAGTGLAPGGPLVILLCFLGILLDHLQVARHSLLPSRKPAPSYAGGMAIAAAVTSVLLLIPGKSAAFLYFQF